MRLYNLTGFVAAAAAKTGTAVISITVDPMASNLRIHNDFAGLPDMAIANLCDEGATILTFEDAGEAHDLFYNKLRKIDAASSTHFEIFFADGQGRFADHCADSVRPSEQLTMAA